MMRGTMMCGLKKDMVGGPQLWVLWCNREGLMPPSHHPWAVAIAVSGQPSSPSHICELCPFAFKVQVGRPALAGWSYWLGDLWIGRGAVMVYGGGLIDQVNSAWIEPQCWWPPAHRTQLNSSMVYDLCEASLCLTAYPLQVAAELLIEQLQPVWGLWAVWSLRPVRIIRRNLTECLWAAAGWWGDNCTF